MIFQEICCDEVVMHDRAFLIIISLTLAFSLAQIGISLDYRQRLCRNTQY